MSCAAPWAGNLLANFLLRVLKLFSYQDHLCCNACRSSVCWEVVSINSCVTVGICKSVFLGNLLVLYFHKMLSDRNLFVSGQLGLHCLIPIGVMECIQLNFSSLRSLFFFFPNYSMIKRNAMCNITSRKMIWNMFCPVKVQMSSNISRLHLWA